MIESKTGWTADEVLARVGTQVTTLGADGVRIIARDAEPIEVKAASGVTAVEPTGVGDAFRAGFLAGLEWELGHERAAQVGCVLAAYVVETVGTQEYSFSARAVRRAGSGSSYGDDAADEVAAPASADPAYDVARDAVVGGLLADVLLTGHPAPGRDVVPRGHVAGDDGDEVRRSRHRRSDAPAR